MIYRPQQAIPIPLRGLGLVAGGGAWVTGILLGAVGGLPPLLPLAGAVIAACLVILLWQDRQWRVIALLGVCLCLGTWRYALADPANDPQSIRTFIGPATVRVRGTVTEMPQSNGRTRNLTVDVTSVSTDNGRYWNETNGYMKVLVMAQGITLEDPSGPNYGDTIELQGKIQPPQEYGARTITASMAFPKVFVRGPGGNRLLAQLYHRRIRLAELIEQTLPQPAAAVLIGITIGLNTAGLQPLHIAFNTTSTTHLLVASGSNITLLSGLITASANRFFSTQKEYLLLPAERRRNGKRLLTTLLTLVCILAYTILCGAGLPVIRASIMGLLVALAPNLGRKYNIYAALAFVLIAMSAADPMVLWDISFQLSYLSSAGIVLLTPYLRRLFHLLGRIPLGKVIVENVAVTLASQIATLPIFAVKFHQVSLVSPFANLLVVPVVELLLPLGLLLCFTGTISMPLAMLCGWVAWPLLKYLTTVVIWWAKFPGACIVVEGLDGIGACGYYALLAVIFYGITRIWFPRSLSTSPPNKQRHPEHAMILSPRAWRGIQLGLAVLVIIITGIQALSPHVTTDTTVTFLANGPEQGSSQGQAILVRTPDKTVLIDGGTDPIFLSQQLDSRLPSWQRSLDLVVLTSPLSQHIGGLQDIVERYSIGMIIDGGMLHPTTTYTRWRRTISRRNIPYTAVSQGATVALGERVMLQILWPATLLHKGSNEIRDNSLIIRLIAPGLRLLLLGESAGSEYALTGLLNQQSTQMLHADIVQVIGGTAQTAPGELMDVLRKAGPTFLIITSTSQRPTASATQSALDPASYTGVNLPPERIITTAHSGTIEIISSGQNWNLYKAVEE